MDYKRVFDTSVLLVTQPARAWRLIHHKGTKNGMLGGFFYPMIILCGTASFFGRFSSNGISFDSFYAALISATVRSLALLFAYYISSYCISFFSKKYMQTKYERDFTDIFTGYSTVVVVVLGICLGFFPEFWIMAFIAQFYTLKIVWDGAAVFMKVPEERRFAYTMIVSLIIMFMPVITDRIMSFLSVLLN